MKASAKGRPNKAELSNTEDERDFFESTEFDEYDDSCFYFNSEGDIKVVTDLAGVPVSLSATEGSLAKVKRVYDRQQVINEFRNRNK